MAGRLVPFVSVLDIGHDGSDHVGRCGFSADVWSVDLEGNRAVIHRGILFYSMV